MPPHAAPADTHSVQIEDLILGDGDVCEPDSTIIVHYHGTLASGQVFDSTRGGEPVEFPLPALIPGWQRGIPGMRVGGKRRLAIPFALAYGEQGYGPVPPRADLVFEIELVDLK